MALRNFPQLRGLLHTAPTSVMADYMRKNYCRKLRDKEIAAHNTSTWYIPHYAAYNPNKPVSGPDYCQPLADDLMKFRQKTIGVYADIVELFHQVKVREGDQAAQRFMWTTEPHKPIEEYTMTVMTFGATCSPCSAQFVKNKNALEFEDD